MIYVETLMLTIVVFALCVASITDIRKGLIPNKLIIIAGSVCVLMDVVYYTFVFREGLVAFICNSLIMIAIAGLLYVLDIWAAGDSKLFFLVSIGIPSRLYSFIPLSYCPLFLLLMIVFSVAFVFSTGETLVRSIIEKRKVWKEINLRISIPKVFYLFMSLLFLFLSVMLCNALISVVLKDNETNSVLLILMMDFLITLILVDIRKKLSQKVIVVANSAMIIIALVLMLLGYLKLSFGSSGLISFIALVVVITVKLLSEKYNYQEIPLESLKCNMILSCVVATRLNMTGVLKNTLLTTETRKARLAQNEVDAIKKNGEKQGYSSVVVVRKLPFAIFIFVGTILFLGVEAAYLWCM